MIDAGMKEATISEKTSMEISLHACFLFHFWILHGQQDSSEYFIRALAL
jgi:hypothetical protein